MLWPKCAGTLAIPRCATRRRRPFGRLSGICLFGWGVRGGGKSPYSLGSASSFLRRRLRTLLSNARGRDWFPACAAEAARFFRDRITKIERGGELCVLARDANDFERLVRAALRLQSAPIEPKFRPALTLLALVSRVMVKKREQLQHATSCPAHPILADC